MLAAFSATPQAQAPTLETVLSRAAAYIEDFQQRLSGVVAEEIYLQQVIPGERRELKADLLLVRPPGLDRWLQFRDIFEVNGRPVRDRQERLSALFLQPAATAMEQARRVVGESSRENAGELRRTINVPIVALNFLDAANQKRFRFTRTANDGTRGDHIARDLPESPHFRVQTEVWVIRFEERQRPTFIRDPLNNRDVVSRGRFWIEPSTGRVLISEIIAEHPDVRAQITVSYQSEPLLGMLMPIEMRETYTNKILRTTPARRWIRIEATATYGRFRQFQVHVDQRIEIDR